MKPSESIGQIADILGVIGGIICLAAGFYLLSSHTQDSNSYLQTIAHGIGIYFLGKGLYVIQSVVRSSAQVWFLARRSAVDETPPTPATVSAA
jgi:uncharacterized membrane protein